MIQLFIVIRSNQSKDDRWFQYRQDVMYGFIHGDSTAIWTSQPGSQDPTIPAGIPPSQLGSHPPSRDPRDPTITSRDPTLPAGIPGSHHYQPGSHHYQPGSHPPSRDPRIPPLPAGIPPLPAGIPPSQPGSQDPTITSRDPTITSRDPSLPAGIPGSHHYQPGSHHYQPDPTLPASRDPTIPARIPPSPARIPPLPSRDPPLPAGIPPSHPPRDPTLPAGIPPSQPGSHHPSQDPTITSQDPTITQPGSTMGPMQGIPTRAGEYAKLKMNCPPKIGRPGEPVGELTRFGWTIISSGKEPLDTSTMLLTQTSQADYEELCRMDVLGLADTPSNDQDNVYEEFKEQLKRDPVGWYETGLPWKGNHPSLPNNKEGSLKRLNSIVRKLERQQLFGQYDDIIKDQIAQGIVEPASEHVEGREFYIPHKPVLRETAESTKLRIVYDASARAYDNAPSLNDCLHAGPPLQNQLWSVLVRARFHSVLITGDMRQAFLQVRVRESDRDALRFHWIADLNTHRVETFRFTRALFGLVSSPFLLGGVVQQHLEASRRDHSEIVNEIQRSLYVDDLITGGSTVEEAKLIKDTATEIFDKAGFTLHKWHSNATELDPNNEQQGACETPETYAKQQLGVAQRVKGTLLGMEWNIENDTIAVKVPSERAQPTKRGLLARLSRIFDPLGFVSPTTLCGKLLYREACELKAAWDAPFPDELTRKLSKWEKMLPERVTIPRQLATQRNHITNIDLHCFGDASGQGVAAAVYAVVSQPTGVNVGLVAAKARLAKQGLTIPRLELVSGHMAVNLITNTRDALKGFPVGELQCWLDSTVALHWIRGAGEYKQFVSNRAHKIQQHKDVKWRHVSSQDNPADLGSRGGRVDKAELWWRGPEWLKDRNDWPNDIMTNTSPESQPEAKVTREVFGLAHDETDEFNVLLNKFTLWKTLRICAWISRFISNSHKSKEHRTIGPLVVEEIQRQKQFWMMRAQESVEGSEKFENDKLQLNLQASSSGLLECRGRIQGHYPIYLPDTHQYTEKLVEELHCATLHGGVGLTMAKVREHFWVPRLRRLAKKVRRNCHGCKRFQVSAYGTPPPAPLPTTRTEGTHPYQVIGVDYAGPIRYRTTRQREGRPERIYSDNAQTFVGASKWIKTVMKDEQLNDFLATQNITWQFNLSRAPWWGGQFERMVGLIKSALNKTIGNGFLWWKELEEVLLDVEVTLNNRPLSYVEEDLQLPTLTPNSMLFLNSNALPDLQPHHVESGNLRKRAKYLLKCKEAMWNRWTKGYVRHLRETHSAKATGQGTAPVIGDVVIVKSDEKNRGRWKLGVVEQLITGRDGIVRGAKIRSRACSPTPVPSGIVLRQTACTSRTEPSNPNMYKTKKRRSSSS
ncbi:hypothetical protein QZH41_020716, partial [Actinostola sp. cb2023]